MGLAIGEYWRESFYIIMKKLILHVGWSKTGTSAIQDALSTHFSTSKNKDVLYPSSCRWFDNAHHHFALAFTNNPVHKSKYEAETACRVMADEINKSTAKTIIISTELSPLYFENPEFSKFLKMTGINNIEIVFTVREQGELLVSMFNQLIKDSQVRCRRTIFETYIRLSSWMNYDLQIKRWEKYVAKEKVKVIPYSENIVADFFSENQLEIDRAYKQSKQVNSSLPNEILEFARIKLLNIKDPLAYEVKLKSIVSDFRQGMFSPLGTELLSIMEIKAIYQHYLASNNAVARKYLASDCLFVKQDFNAIENIGIDKDNEI